jgi:hypothetical protein
MPILGIWASSFRSAVGPQGAYDALATVTVPSGGAASVSFVGIPSGYKHLQVRYIARTNRSSLIDGISIRYNSDSGTNYTNHSLLGDGANASASAGTGQTYSAVNVVVGNTAGANMFGAGVIDLLDYANISKYKTMRTIGGFDRNGGGYAALYSGLWLNTAAITSLTFGSTDGTGLLEFSQFSLFGVK